MASDSLGGSRLWPEAPIETLKHSPWWRAPRDSALPVLWPPPPSTFPVPAQSVFGCLGTLASASSSMMPAGLGQRELKDPPECFSTKGKRSCAWVLAVLAVSGLGRDPGHASLPCLFAHYPWERSAAVHSTFHPRAPGRQGSAPLRPGNACKLQPDHPGIRSQQTNPSTGKKKKKNKKNL